MTSMMILAPIVKPRTKASRLYGAVFPYHSSSRIFIFAYLLHKERASLSRENPIQSRSVLVIRLSFPCHMHVLLFVVAHTIPQKLEEVQALMKALKMISQVFFPFSSYMLSTLRIQTRNYS